MRRALRALLSLVPGLPAIPGVRPAGGQVVAARAGCDEAQAERVPAVLSRGGRVWHAPDRCPWRHDHGESARWAEPCPGCNYPFPAGGDDIVLCS